MMNYKGWAIPEGNVVKVEDAAGNVLWKQAPSGATVKVTVSNGGNFASMTNSPNIYLTIDGMGVNTAQELVVAIGTVIPCKCTAQTNQIYLNGENVGAQIDSYTFAYDYTVTGDVEIVLNSIMTMQGGGMGSAPTQKTEANIYITEL